MDIRDYLRMLRRGWPVIVLVACLFVLLAAAYLAITPKRYESTAVLLVSTNEPVSVTDLELGSQFTTSSMAMYAQIVDSTTVLGQVATALRPQRTSDDLVGSVSASVRTGTRLIDITAAGDDPAEVATVANAAAAAAARIIPALENPRAAALIRMVPIGPAVQPSVPVSPNARRVLAVGFVVGLLLGLAGTIAAQALDTRIRRSHDLGLLTQVPLLAALPRVKRSQRHSLLARDDPAGAAGEAFRTLRTNVRFVESKDRRSLVLTAVTDDSDGAGVPINLGWMLAEVGHRVLLVDVDLRQPSVGSAFGIDSGPGVAEVLAGLVDLPEVFRKTGHPNLRVVASGALPPNPSELLSSPSLGAMLRRMESMYDYVILHAPPLLAHSDAAVVSQAADGTLLLVTAGRTRAQELTTAMTSLANVGVAPLGVVLTRAGGSVVERRKPKAARKRAGHSMRHRFDWDWRSSDAKALRRHAGR